MCIRDRPTTDLDDLPQGRLADPHDQPHAVELRLAVRDALRTLPELSLIHI